MTATGLSSESSTSRRSPAAGSASSSNSHSASRDDVAVFFPFRTADTSLSRWGPGNAKRTASMGTELEDVDGREDDDPHHVDEVPVDARHLDAEVVLRVRSEVAAPGADVGEGEQHQTDEDVGAVQAREAVEDRAEGAVAGREADVDVLVDLDEEKGRAQQPGHRQAHLKRAPIAPAHALQRPVDREARGDEDRGVDAGDRL